MAKCSNGDQRRISPLQLLLCLHPRRHLYLPRQWLLPINLTQLSSPQTKLPCYPTRRRKVRQVILRPQALLIPSYQSQVPNAFVPQALHLQTRLERRNRIRSIKIRNRHRRQKTSMPGPYNNNSNNRVQSMHRRSFPRRLRLANPQSLRFVTTMTILLSPMEAEKETRFDRP